MSVKLEEADKLNTQGHDFWLAGEYQKAEELLHSAVVIFESENSDLIAKPLHNLGNLYHDTKRPNESLKALERSLVHFESLGRKDSMVDVLTSMSLCFLDSRKWDLMEKHLKQGLELVDTKDYSRIGDLEHNLALCYQRKFIFDDAEDLFWRSYRTFEKISDEYTRKNGMLASINELLEFYDHNSDENSFDEVLQLKDDLITSRG